MPSPKDIQNSLWAAGASTAAKEFLKLKTSGIEDFRVRLTGGELGRWDEAVPLSDSARHLMVSVQESIFLRLAEYLAEKPSALETLMLWRLERRATVRSWETIEIMATHADYAISVRPDDTRSGTHILELIK